MPNGRHVAVERFSTKTFNPSSLDWNRIRKRISAITTIYDHHPKLAAIRGWCYDNRETILVYDYFQNGTLDRWLFGLGGSRQVDSFISEKKADVFMFGLLVLEIIAGKKKVEDIQSDDTSKEVLDLLGFALEMHER
ncbi:hypothetical protein REPUB_Repub08aG0190600 [Reevesia pubescens]